MVNVRFTTQSNVSTDINLNISPEDIGEPRARVCAKSRHPSDRGRLWHEWDTDHGDHSRLVRKLLIHHLEDVWDLSVLGVRIFLAA